MTVYIPISLIVYALVFAAGCLYGWIVATVDTFNVYDKLGLIFFEFVLVTVIAGMFVAMCGYHVSVLLY